MRGRKPKPTALKLAEGNPGKRKINRGEPKPDGAAPACPRHLKGEARKEWVRLVPELEKIGLMTKVDLAAMACYCESWGLYLQALAAMARPAKKGGGAVTVTDKGNQIQSPWLAIANRQKALIRSFLAEFGLTPATRSRLSITPVKTPGDDLAAFMRIAQ